MWCLLLRHDIALTIFCFISTRGQSFFLYIDWQEYVSDNTLCLDPLSDKLPLLSLQENDKRLIDAVKAAKATFPGAIANGRRFVRNEPSAAAGEWE